MAGGWREGEQEGWSYLQGGGCWPGVQLAKQGKAGRFYNKLGGQVCTGQRGEPGCVGQAPALKDLTATCKLPPPTK